MKLRIPPPVIMIIAATLMWACQRWLPLAQWVVPPWNRLGFLAAILGVAISALALMRFRQARTTVNPMDPGKATHLVTDGIFSVSRNPMYLGLLLLLIGWALWLGSASVWIIPPLFVLGITYAQIVPEEQALSDLFGAQYAAYRQRVGRWVGRRGT